MVVFMSLCVFFVFCPRRVVIQHNHLSDILQTVYSRRFFTHKKRTSSNFFLKNGRRGEILIILYIVTFSFLAITTTYFEAGGRKRS